MYADLSCPRLWWSLRHSIVSAHCTRGSILFHFAHQGRPWFWNPLQSGIFDIYFDWRVHLAGACHVASGTSNILRMPSAIAHEFCAKLDAQNCKMCLVIIVSQDLIHMCPGQQHNPVVSKADSKMQMYKISCHLTYNYLAFMTRFACTNLRRACL